VHVDEAGRQHQPAAVDHPAGAVGPEVVPHGHDGVVADGDAGRTAARAGAVHQCGADDQQVVDLSQLEPSPTTPRARGWGD
jgi:hypothetical protein